MPAKRPRVIVNFAITADGKVSTRAHTSAGFTSPMDKRLLRAIRASGDAVLAGAKTVAADTMSMGISDDDLRTVRVSRGLPPEPLRVIVSNQGDLDPRWKVFQPRPSPLVIFSTTRMPEALRPKIARRAELWLFETEETPLETALEILRRDYQVRRLVCEGGPTLFRALLERDLVDEIHLTWAAVVFGGKKAPTLTGLPGAFLPHLTRCELSKMEVGDGECYLTYRVKRTASDL